MACAKIIFKINQRDITPKLSKGEQPILYETCCLNLIYIAIKFHHDTPNPYIVMESKRTGPGCSKLTTSLVNVSLKFQTLISQICHYFVLKNV